MGFKNERIVSAFNQSYLNQKQLQQKINQRKRKLLIRRLTVFFSFAAVIIYLLISTLLSQSETLENKQAEMEKLKKEYHELKERQIILKEEINKLQDDEYIGKFARKEFFLSGDNEIIFSTPDEEDEEENSTD